MIKNDVSIVKKRGLSYVADGNNNIRTYKPWLGDLFSFLYDFIMSRSVFPKKFEAEIEKHYDILKRELGDVHEESVLELAAGSGSAVNFLPSDNKYCGSDISPGLLRKACKKFTKAGFKNLEFYITDAEELPFKKGMFSVCLCILSLNFFNDINNVMRETARVLKNNGVFLCSVPVPERNKRNSTIRGTLYSADELRTICEHHGFIFNIIPDENGALLYFKAIAEQGSGT